jgi:hypothetical protein
VHLQNVTIEQNKWLRVMQQEQPLIQESPLQDEGKQAAFYTQNQAWLMGEVEEYVQKIKAEKRDNAEG